MWKISTQFEGNFLILPRDFAQAYFNRDTENDCGLPGRRLQWGIDVFSGGEVISDILVKQISGVEDTEIGAIHVMSWNSGNPISLTGCNT